MLTGVDLEKKVSKKEYARLAPPLIKRLGTLQRQAHEAGLPVVIVLEGWHGAGKGMLLNFFNQSLDARGFRIFTVDREAGDEEGRPWLWRYWTRIPAHGQIAVFDTSWYQPAVAAAVKDKAAAKRLAERCEDIQAFERMLTDDGYVVVKLFLHIGREEQKERLQDMSGDEYQAWRIGGKAWKQNRRYKRYYELYDRLLASSNSAAAPWTVLPAHDRHVVKLQAAEAVIAAVEAGLATREAAGSCMVRTSDINPDDRRPPATEAGTDYPEELYHQELENYQKRLRMLQFETYRADIPAVIVFEGWDAAGKGGAIHRLCHSLDPRGYRVVPVSAPDSAERRHHYLWRFWREFPAAGEMVVFDRSWYGRVLVERVEGLASRAEWERAYREINATEDFLARHGAVIVKFWLDITPEEQLKRFREREEDPDKVWKITEEDWRNRARWAEYEAAVVRMLKETQAANAAWHVVDANHKRRARLEVLRIVVAALEARCAQAADKG